MNADSERCALLTAGRNGMPGINRTERCVRVAYNNEGYAILGYRAASLSVGEP